MELLHLNSNLLFFVFSYLDKFQNKEVRNQILNRKAFKSLLNYKTSFVSNPSTFKKERILLTGVDVTCALENKFCSFKSIMNKFIIAICTEKTWKLSVFELNDELKEISITDTGHTMSVSCLRHFQHDEDYIISASWDLTAKVFNSKSNFGLLITIELYEFVQNFLITVNTIQAFYHKENKTSYLVSSMYQVEYVKIFSIATGKMLRENLDYMEECYYSDVFYCSQVDDYLILTLFKEGFKLYYFKNFEVYKKVNLTIAHHVTASHFRNDRGEVIIGVGSIEGTLYFYNLALDKFATTINMGNGFRCMLSWGSYIVAGVKQTIKIISKTHLTEVSENNIGHHAYSLGKSLVKGNTEALVICCSKGELVFFEK